MRKELEAIEKIERYLKNQLSEADKSAFEKQLTEDPKLREEVEVQRELLQGIGRVVLKQQLKKAYQKYWMKKMMVQWGIVLAVTAAVALGILYFTSMKNGHRHGSFINSGEKGSNETVDAYQVLPAQNFSINSSGDTVIETDAGITFAIPANCFLDAEGNPAEGNIDLEIKEALNAASILQAGLSTMSDGRLLESAGMFYINARKDEENLRIDPAKNIYAEVPALKGKKENMQLFDGEVNEKGIVNWVNPKPVERFLTPVDILSLNFYPPGYLDSLRNWGYNEKDKKFTDSLYYSFAYLFDQGSTQARDSMVEEKSEYINSVPYTFQTVQYTPDQFYHGPEGINPAKIKTIWNKKYNNTLLATREFEQRLQLIHQSCNGKLLDLYVNHLDRRLSELDSAAANMEEVFGNSFLALARLNEGRVQINASHLKKLSEYYALKEKAYTEAAAKTERAYWEKQRELEQKAKNKKWKHDNEDWQREAENLQKEYDLNLTEACRQLGIKKSVPYTGPVYGVSIASTGWKNIDAYVMEATVNRTTLDYTSEDGKKAVIRYEPISILIKESKSFDRLYVYLLPDKLNSFMRLTPNGDRFDEKLNELMTCKLMCLGYKGEDAYFYEIEKAESKDYGAVELRAVDKKQLENKLKALDNTGHSSGMVKELDYWESEIAEVKRKKAADDKLRLAEKVREVIFPCYQGEETALDLNGEELFKRHCGICHGIHKKVVGPSLAGMTKRWTRNELKQWILNSAKLIASGNPKAIRVYNEYNKMQMPATPLSDEEIEAIAFYVDGIRYSEAK